MGIKDNGAVLWEHVVHHLEVGVHDRAEPDCIVLVTGRCVHMRQKFVGYVTTSPAGRTRVLLASNPHNFVDVPDVGVVSCEQVDQSSSVKTITVDSDDLQEGWIDNVGYESLFYDEKVHQGRLAESAFARFDRPQSWDHESGYARCYSRLFC